MEEIGYLRLDKGADANELAMFIGILTAARRLGHSVVLRTDNEATSQRDGFYVPLGIFAEVKGDGPPP